MTPSGNLLAWIDRRGVDEFLGAFVGEDAIPDVRRHQSGRAPAMKLCSSSDEARHWVEEQAAAFGLPIKWVSNPAGTAAEAAKPLRSKYFFDFELSPR